MASYQSYNSQGSHHWDQQQQQQWSKARREERVRNRAAALSVRKVIVRFRHATRGTYEELHKELHASEQENRAMMGEEAAKVREEILRAVKQVQTRFAAEPPEEKAAPHAGHTQQPRQDAASEAADNGQMMSEVEALAQAASEEVELAEAKVAEVAGVADPIIEASVAEGAAAALAPNEALTVADATEKAMGAAVARIKESAAKVVEKAREMGGSPEAVQMKNSPDFTALHERLGACKQVIEKLRAKVAAAREDANAKLAESGGSAEAEPEATGDTFTKYDKDGDGLLSIDDMVELAKNEHDFELTEEHLGWILEDLGEGATGVTAEHFPWLESTIQELQWSYCLAKTAFEEVQAAEALVVAAEQAAAPLLQEPNAAEAVVLERVRATEEAVASAIPAIKGAAGTVVEKAREMGQSALVERVKNSEEYLDLHSRLMNCKSTIQTIRSIVTSAQEKCKGGGGAAAAAPAAAAPPVEPLSQAAELTALVALHARIAAAVDTFRSEKGVKSQAELLGMSGIGSGSLDMDKFIAFVELLGGASAVDTEAGAADICSFFAYLSAGEETLSKEKLASMFAPPRLRAIKDTLLTENRDLGLGMKTACRLQVDDIVIPIGPLATTVGSHRLRCRAIKDGTEGWATMVGTNGTQLLEVVSA